MKLTTLLALAAFAAAQYGLDVPTVRPTTTIVTVPNVIRTSFDTTTSVAAALATTDLARAPPPPPGSYDINLDLTTETILSTRTFIVPGDYRTGPVTSLATDTIITTRRAMASSSAPLGRPPQSSALGYTVVDSTTVIVETITTTSALPIDTVIVLLNWTAPGGIISSSFTTTTVTPAPTILTLTRANTLHTSITVVFGATATNSPSSTPGVSTSPTPTAAVITPPHHKKSFPAFAIGIIIVVPLLVFGLAGVGFYFMKKTRDKEKADEASAAYKRRDWNSARPAISSPQSLSVANLATLDMSTAPPSTKYPGNAPPRPERPASLTESIQESMRKTPVSAMRKTPGSLRSEGTAYTMSGARGMSPKPLNIVKEGEASRDRSETNTSTTAHFGDRHTRNSSGVESIQLQELEKTEGEFAQWEQDIAARAPGVPYPPYPDQAQATEQSVNSAGSSGHGHPDTVTYTTAPRPMNAMERRQLFLDSDEEDEVIRTARRLSAERKLDGQAPETPGKPIWSQFPHTRPTTPAATPATTPTPIFDPIAARAERMLIATKQMLIGKRQKEKGGPSKNITDFSAGPMPPGPPPPPPGPPPGLV